MFQSVVIPVIEGVWKIPLKQQMVAEVGCTLPTPFCKSPILSLADYDIAANAARPEQVIDCTFSPVENAAG